MIDKGSCDKGFIWNPSNCECECDKSCDVGEYLDYENCNCRKRLLDKLVEECSKNIEEKEFHSSAVIHYENLNKIKYNISHHFICSHDNYWNYYCYCLFLLVFK